MEAEERHRTILARARQEGRVDVATLAVDLAVAPETVRRDLKHLVDRGMIQRVYGGAYPVESVGFESNLHHRTTSLIAEKRRLAVVAAGLLEDAESVFVDEGVTPQLVAETLVEHLRPGQKLTIVTSSLLAAAAVATSPDITVIMLGGRVRGLTLGTVDHWTVRMLSELVIDLAFIGANGISREHGLTTPDPAVAAVKSEVVARARRKVFVGVHTKFGVTSFCRFAEIADFTTLVTDSGLSAGEARRYSALGPQVLRA